MSDGSAAPGRDVRAELRLELESLRAEFHELLDSLSDEDVRRRSNNPGWTNGQILFHMTFALMLLRILAPMVRLWARLPRWCSRAFAGTLDFGTPLFNWFNELGARGGGRVYSGERVARRFDAAHRSTMRMLDRIKDDEWQAGMYYPSRWDPLFGSYMTLEDVFRYPARHFRFHIDQISR